MILAQTVLEIISSEAVRCCIFDRFFNFQNHKPEVVSDVISGTADQDDGMDIFANFGDSRLKPSDASFPALLATSITSNRKYIVMSCPVWLWTQKV